MTNAFVETLNLWSSQVLPFLGPMLWQSSLLITILFALDLALRRKLRAAVRYALWLVLVLKLILPPSFAFPTGAAWWLRGHPATIEPKPRTASLVIGYSPALTAASALDFPDNAIYFPISKPRLSTAGRMLTTSACVSLALFGWMLLHWGRVARHARRAAPAPASLNELLKATRPQTWLPQGVRIKLTEAPLSPAVCGLFRPVILFPRSLAEQLSPVQLRAVLLHELFHLKRGDVWVSLIQTLLQIVYWWHPLLWLANARIRRLREEAVDDSVMLALREEAETYAPTLLEVAKVTLQRPRASLGLVGILESKHALKQRIERLMTFHAPHRAGLSFLSILAILSFSALAIPMGEAPVRRVKPLAAPPSEPNSWPDPRFEGYAEVDLQAEFFTVDSAALREVSPDLAEGNGPVVLASNEVASVQDSLEQAKTKPFADGNPLVFQQFSGGRFHYRIGAVTNNLVNYQTSVSGEHGFTAGAQIQLVAALPGWVPLELTLVPWIENDSIRCDLQLAVEDDANAVQRAELSVPHGGAILWATSEEMTPGKRQLLLLQNNKAHGETGLSQGTEPGTPRSRSATNTAALEKWIKINNLLSEAKSLLDSDRLDEAENILKEANKAEPQNQRINHYLSILKNARHQAAAKADSASDIIEREAARTQRDERQLILHEFKTAGYSLPESIVDSATGKDPSGLATRFFRVDPQGLLRGLGNVSGLSLPDLPRREVSGGGGGVGVPLVPGGLESFSAGDENGLRRTVTIEWALHRFFTMQGVDLKDPAKKILYEEAKGMLTVRANPVDLDAIEFLLPKLEQLPEPLYTRMFKIDLETLRRGLREALGPVLSERVSRSAASDSGRTANGCQTVTSDLREFFLDRHVDLGVRGGSLFYTCGEGVLMVRATERELEIIEEAIQKFVALRVQPGIHSPANENPAIPTGTSNGSAAYARTAPVQQAKEPELLTRMFKLDPKTLKQRLEESVVQLGSHAVQDWSSPNAGVVQQAVRDFLTAAGIDPTPPRGIFWNDHEGTLLVRATVRELEIAEQALQSLNTAPPQVHIGAKFFEIDEKANKRVMDWLQAHGATNLTTNAISPRIIESGAPKLRPSIYGNPSTSNSISFNISGILSEPQFRVVVRALEQRDGVDLLLESSVTTLSGRQAEVQMVDLTTVVTAPDWTPQTPSTSTNLYQTQQVPVGPVLDVTPFVQGDGVSIKMSLVGTVTDFLGYDNPRQIVSNAMATLPLPHFRLRQLTTSAEVRDGQTIMVGGLVAEEDIKKHREKVPILGDLPLMGRMFRSESTIRSKKHLLIFVTPTLIDPAGNRIHSEDQSPARSR
jgi:beta-lactamase regulating signal transducer with metallopeptidase domain